METLLSKIEAELSAAMKTKSEEVKNGKKENTDLDSLMSVLRLIKAELVKANNKAEYTLSNEQEIKTLMKMCSQREDSVKQYKKGGREDLAVKEEQEIKFIKAYLPKMPSADEMKTYINSTIAEYIASKEEGYTVSLRDMGTIMKTVKAKYPTVDGNLVKETLLSYDK